MGGYRSKLGSSLDTTESYRVIGPTTLEKYLGEFVGKIYFFRDKNSLIGYSHLDDQGRLDLNDDGDFCLKGNTTFGAIKNVIRHGDTISLPTRDGLIYSSSYIFIDDSD